MKLTVKQAFERAVSAHQSGNLEDATLLYQAILKTLPNLPEANYNLAILNTTKGNLTHAIHLLQKASEAEPRSYQYLSLLIEVLLKKHQFDLANETLLKAKNAGLPKSQIISLELKIEAETKKHDDFNSRIPPQEILSELVKYYQEGRLDLAERLGRELTSTYPMHPLGWQVVGIVLKEAGRSLDALEFVATSAELSSNDAQAQNNLGVVLQDLGDLRDAQKSYERAIEINPEYADAYNNLGSTLYAFGKIPKAKKMYEKAISINSGNARFYCNLGNVLRDTGQLLKAKAIYKQAISLEPSLLEAFLNLAKMSSDVMDVETVSLLEDTRIFHEHANLDAGTHHFYRANVFKHQGDLNASFGELCKANDSRWKSAQEQAELEYLEHTECLERIRKWKPKTQVSSKGTLAKLIIAGPSRSGKSLLERYIGEISNTKPLYESFQMSYALQNGSKDTTNSQKLFEDIYLESADDLLKQGYKAVTATNPGQILHADYLLDYLENSYLLVISRDKRDNISEIFAMDYTKGNAYSYSQSAIIHYLEIYHQICDAIYEIVPDRCIRICFEDLVENPKRTLSHLSVFLENVLELDCELIPNININSKSIFREYVSLFGA